MTYNPFVTTRGVDDALDGVPAMVVGALNGEFILAFAEGSRIAARPDAVHPYEVSADPESEFIGRLYRQIDNLKQELKNVHKVREHEHRRAEKALAELKAAQGRLKIVTRFADKAANDAAKFKRRAEKAEDLLEALRHETKEGANAQAALDIIDTAPTVRCNKCGWKGRQEDLEFAQSDVCPNCRTDHYLMDAPWEHEI